MDAVGTSQPFLRWYEESLLLEESTSGMKKMAETCFQNLQHLNDFVKIWFNIVERKINKRLVLICFAHELMKLGEKNGKREVVDAFYPCLMEALKMEREYVEKSITITSQIDEFLKTLCPQTQLTPSVPLSLPSPTPTRKRLQTDLSTEVEMSSPTPPKKKRPSDEEISTHYKRFMNEIKELNIGDMIEDNVEKVQEVAKDVEDLKVTLKTTDEKVNVLKKGQEKLIQFKLRFEDIMARADSFECDLEQSRD